MADRSFIASAATAGMFEIQVAQLALSRTSDAAVKAYASMVIDDHTNENNELAQLASVRGVTMPVQLPKELQAELRRLTRDTGAAFDRAFVQLQERSHLQDIEEFEVAAHKSQEGDLKAWIDRTLP
ncbi:MAG: DUF4142 domain-containing protein, partial [Caldimonas sp.]